jgi:hypothetical protein
MTAYPFLFAIQKEEDGQRLIGHYVVVIASTFNYEHVDTAWMNDPSLPSGATLSPGLDLEDTQHRFKTEHEALSFIKNWWKKHRIEG